MRARLRVRLRNRKRRFRVTTRARAQQVAGALARDTLPPWTTLTLG